MADGDQMAIGYKWTAMYVRCYRNRTLAVDHCPGGAVFDPSKRICVSKIKAGKLPFFGFCVRNKFVTSNTNVFGGQNNQDSNILHYKGVY